MTCQFLSVEDNLTLPARTQQRKDEDVKKKI
jgi:hypothetical protein